MSLSFRSALPVALLLAASAASAQNLLVNPGAEAGDLSGWTVGGPASVRVDNGSFNPGINPFEGSFSFVGGNGAFGSLTQTVTIADLGGHGIANVSFWEQGLNQGTPSDHAYVSLSFLNGANSVLQTVSTPAVDSHLGSWQQYSGSFAIPTGTVKIAYTMNFVRSVGSDLDGYVDSNVLTVSAVPEPASALLMAAGLLMVPLLKRRRS
ncbi:PEP-CTERM sorting domain-containing protein [Roseateles sp. BYS78W]|uniref:PEP-CTERM sorting domain-containing protein n=1 Tax=Pelomonas candidula TaxID=3299025 RepID=A0ABW7HHC9_9BURK